MSQLFPNRETSKPKFVWRATYADGTIVNQFDEEKNELNTEQVDRNGLRHFEFIDEFNETVASFTMLPGDTVAFRRRTQVKAGVGLVARYYLVAINRDGFSTVFYLNEETKEVRIERIDLSKTYDGTNIHYPIAEVDTDKIPIE